LFFSYIFSSFCSSPSPHPSSFLQTLLITLSCYYPELLRHGDSYKIHWVGDQPIARPLYVMDNRAQ
jgi:hypothetical protein